MGLGCETSAGFSLLGVGLPRSVSLLDLLSPAWGDVCLAAAGALRCAVPLSPGPPRLARPPPPQTPHPHAHVQGPGMLFRALSVFALRDIDLTKIESRPMRSAPLLQPTATAASTAAAAAALGTAADAAGQQQVPPAVTGRSFNYLFYVDFRGCLADEAAQNALRHLQEFAPFLRVLGSYPADPEL